MKALAGHYDFQDRRVLTDLRARKRINPKNNTVETVIENSVSYSHSLDKKDGFAIGSKHTRKSGMFGKDSVRFRHSLKKQYD